MEPIPYLAVQLKRWGATMEIHLPTDTEFGEDLGMLIDVVCMANRVPGWEDLIPTHHSRMFQYVRLADYLNTRRLLDDLAGYLGTQSSLIEASNAKHIVRH